MGERLDIERVNQLGKEKLYNELHAYIAPYAASGDPDAIAMLGICYDFGYAVPLNRELAIECFCKSAKAGSIYGQFHYGWYLAHDYEKDTETVELGTAHLSAAAMSGCAQASYELGNIFENSIKWPYDEERIGCAHVYYQQAAEKHYLPAQLHLGLLLHRLYLETLVEYQETHQWTIETAMEYYDEEERLASRFYYPAVKILQVVAEKNNPVAQAALGEMLYNREDTRAEGIGWLEKAAQCEPFYCGENIIDEITKQHTGHTISAELYTPEPFCWLNYGRKIRMILDEQSGNEHLRPVRFLLGVHYRSHDDAKSAYWFEQDIKFKNDGTLSHLYLGILSYYGRGTAVDYQKAFAHFMDAYQQDPSNPETLFYLALCHYYGHGTQESFTDAYNYFVKASQANTREGHLSKYYQGVLLYYGKGVERNKDAAISLMKESARLRKKNVMFETKLDHPHQSEGWDDEYFDFLTDCGLACFFLGYLYEIGLDVPQNLLTACEYYHKGLESTYEPVDMLMIRDSLKYTFYPSADEKFLLDKHMELLSKYQEIASRQFKELEKDQTAFRSAANNLTQANENLDKLQNFIAGLQKAARKTENPDNVLLTTMSEAINREFDKMISPTHKLIRQAQEELKEIFDKYWNELHPNTIRSLTASRVYSSLLGKADIDYSGVCITAFAALENELKLRLVDGYRAYLETVRPNSSDNWPDNWPRFMRGELIDNNDPNKGYRIRDTLTLGNVPYFLQHRDKEMRDKYLETLVRPEKNRDGIQINLESVKNCFSREKYEAAQKNGYSLRALRNDAAHKGNISFDDACLCMPINSAVDAGTQVQRTVLGLIYELVSLTTIPQINEKKGN